MLQTLAETRGLGAVGVELFSDAMDALPAGEVGRRAGDSVQAALAGVLGASR